ncbi:hypothetical protein HK104_006888, partial [Borealophlyctis nickersoniae]
MHPSPSTLIDQTTGPKYSYNDHETWIATFTFLCVWILVAKQWDAFPLGKSAAALLGAAVMVLTGVITPEEAVFSISSNTLFLLFGLMIILAKLEEKGLMLLVQRLLLFGKPTPTTLLIRVSLLSALLAATVMNDGAAIFLSSVVMSICEQAEVPVEPYAMALATSANLGSAATIIGNPKNMIVNENMPSTTFLTFTLRMGPAALAAILLNTFLVVVWYRATLKGKRLRRLKRMQHGVAGSEEGEKEDVEEEEEETEEESGGE